MTSKQDQSKIKRKWQQRVFIGQLADDFLRLTDSSKKQNKKTKPVTQNQNRTMTTNQKNRLNIIIDQAKLVKNYGIPKMNPYVKLRVDQFVCETQADIGGGKNPRWNQSVRCTLPNGVNNLYLEILDECYFTNDQLIAWSHVTIPKRVMLGEIAEDWYPLSGKQGDSKEGMIRLIISLKNNPLISPLVMVPSTAQNILGTPQYSPVSIYTQPQVNPSAITPQIVSQIEEMFPNIEKTVVRMVYESNRGNKDATVNLLLEMSDV